MTAAPPTPSAKNASTARHLPANLKTLPPLSPLTYYRRNVWRVLPVAGAIVISVFLIAAIVTLLNSVDDSITAHYSSLKSFSVLTPQFERDVEPPVRKKASSFPQVGRTVVAIPYFVLLRTVFGEMPVPIYGLDTADMPRFAAITGNKLEPGGRWPKLNEPEVVLSRTWANNFHVKVGQLYDPNNERLPALVEKQRVVGIVSGGANIAIADKTYLMLTLPDTVMRPSYILIPKRPSLLAPLTQNLKDLVEKPKKFGFQEDQTRLLRVFSYSGLVNELRRSLGFLYRFLAIADALVIGAVALLSGFLANIYFEQRLGEFGLLSALGFRRERLARRLIIETSSLVVVAWVLGLGLTALLFWALDTFYMMPNGLVLSKIGVSALGYTLPTPVLVGVASLATVLTRLYRLDPIEIMERR